MSLAAIVDQILIRLDSLEARMAAVEGNQAQDYSSAGTVHEAPKRSTKGEHRRFQWDGDWSKLPHTLTARHMAAIEGVTVDTIWHRIQRRTMQPKPLRWWKPYRWLRDQVRAELER